MRTFRILAALVMAVVCVSLSSCSKDDNVATTNNEGGNSSITGTTAKVDLKKAGSLSTLISDDVKFNITDLTITGDINGDDIRFIREMAGADVNGDETEGHLSVLNLKDANVITGGNPYYVPSSTQAYYSKKNTISSYMFSNCNSLTSIILPESIVVIEECIFSYYDNSPSLMTKGNPNLTSITIGNKVTTIQTRAFAATGITTINIPKGVIKLESEIFRDCSNLTTITLPNSITEIGTIYSGCTGITHITIPSGTTIIEMYAFEGCTRLKEIKIPDKVTGIKEGAFANCTNLVSISIGSGLRYIGAQHNIGEWDNTFWGCNSLMEFVVSKDNLHFTGIDGMLLSKNSDQLIAFPNAKLQANIPNTVTKIGGPYYYENYDDYNIFVASPFRYSSLTSVTIPASVNSIGLAFNYCPQLTEVHIKCITPPQVYSSFREMNEECILYVPRGTLDAYKKTDWKFFTNIIEE